MYIDILVGEEIDEKRFVDMYTILAVSSKKEGIEYKDRIVEKVSSYFNEVLNAVRLNDEERLKQLSKHIHEARYTRLGYSVSGPGKGFGGDKFSKLIQSMKKSNAFATGVINDILDVELYVDNIGVDIISDLITNLIQDILSEYTEEKLNSLAMAHLIRKIKTHYWDENGSCWAEKELTMLQYKKNIQEEGLYYLLVPQSYTCDEKQKERIIDNIFENSIHKVCEKIIFNNMYEYGQYVKSTKKGPILYKKQAARFINEQIGDGLAKEEGNGYITSKGLLDLIEKYPEIKNYIDNMKIPK